MQVSLNAFRHLYLTYLIPQGRKFALLGLLLVVSIALQLVNPQILRFFIDTITTHGSLDALTLAALLFIVVALVQSIVAVTAAYLSERVGWLATNALRADLMLHLLRLDLSFHKVHTPGEMIERIDGDVTALANFFSQFVIQVAGNLLLLLGIIVLMWIENLYVGLAFTLYAVIVLAILIRLRAFSVPYWRKFRQASAELYGFLEERLSGTEDIRSSGAQAYAMRRLYEFMRTRVHTGRMARLMGSLPWGVPILFIALGYILIFALSLMLYQLGSIQIGTAFLFYAYLQIMFRPLNQISNQLDDFQKASAGIVRIQEFLALRSTLEDGAGVAYPTGPLAVEFDDVSFGYGDDEMVLADVSFQLAPGQVLGLLGRTGSGKTTIARLFFRLYDPESGTIRLNGSDIRNARQAELRRRIGIVTQEVQLFHASVRDNLTLFDAGIPDRRILEVLADLGLSHWFQSLPQGLDTKLAPGGSGLSAGEAQLLAFTRVFLKDPSVVILDEASSRLDPATENLIEAAVDKLLRGRTGIIIAHRLTTIQRADTILIMDGGRVAELGSRVRLAGDPDSYFTRLLRAAHEEVPA